VKKTFFSEKQLEADVVYEGASSAGVNCDLKMAN
jgi:hypothetical protein